MFRSNPSPLDSSWLSLGNETSCNLLVFLQIAGHNGALLYNLSLNIFYLCLVKYNVKRSKYRSRIEPFLHGIPICWSLASASIVVGTGHANATDSLNKECFIAASPPNCLKDPKNLTCTRGKQAVLYRIIFFVGPVLVVYTGILLTLWLLWQAVRAQDKRMEKYRMSNRFTNVRRRSEVLLDNPTHQNAPRRNSLPAALLVGDRRASWKDIRRSFGLSTGPSTNQRPESFRRPLRRRRQSGKPFLVQAQWYTVAFVLTYTFPMIMLFSIKFESDSPPATFILLARIFNPLQGFFNILVYTRPHVAKERSRNPSLSWFAAFLKVCGSGGDDNGVRTNRLRNGTPSLNRDQV